MKKLLIILLLVICGFLFLSGSGQAKGFIKGLSLRVSGDYGTAKIGDLNLFAQGRNDYLGAYAEVLNLMLGEEDRIKKDGNLKDIIAGTAFDGELMLNVFGNFAVAVGAGYIQQSKKSGARLLDGENEIYAESYNPAVSAVPVHLSLYYFYNILPSMKLFFKAGVGYYFAKSTSTFYLDSQEPWGTPYSETYDLTIKDQGFGYHGGFGYEFDLGSRFSFFVEAQGRYCTLKNWEGTSRYIDPAGNVEEISGTVWHFEAYDAVTDEYYSLNYLSADQPDDPTFQNVRKFECDFSGISLKLGIRIKF